MDRSYLQQGLGFVNEAISYDQSGNYPEALRLYQRAVRLFKQSQTEEHVSPEVASVLPSKIKEYETRIDHLELEMLDSDDHTWVGKPNQMAPKGNDSTWGHVGVEGNETEKSGYVGMERDDMWEGENMGRRAQEQQNSPDLEFDQFTSVQYPVQQSSSKKISENQKPEKISEKEKNYSHLQQGRRGESSLECGLRLANKAKKKDNKKKYAEAFIFYTQALEYFSDAAKHAPGGIMVSLNKTMKAYMDRAEKIKAALEKYNQVPKVKKPVFPTEESVVEYHLRKSKLENFDGRIGPLSKKIATSFWNDKRPFFFQAKISQNIISLGDTMGIEVILDNKTNVTIHCLRVYLEQANTTTTIALNGTKSAVTTITKMHRDTYQERLPMGEGRYEGKFNYSICPDLDPTEADNSACFAREYEIVVLCEIPYHQNVFLNIPIRLF